MFSDRRYAIAAAALVVLKLWLVAAQPVVAMGGAVHDDRLFLTLSEHLLRGEWLGDYSEFTLMKGPMYSLWIAGTFLAGVPLPLANHLLYLLACCLVVRALRPRLAHDGFACAIFALLWWNPMTYEMAVLGRVLRQNLYTPAALLLFAGLFAFETRRDASLVRRIAWGSLAGLSLSALWLTREESVWALPAVVLLVCAAAWNSWRAGERLRPLIAPLVAAVAAFGIPLGGVAGLNLHYYGWFGTNEFRAPQFLAAYGALQRIQVADPLAYVPVTRAARQSAYAVSPSFAKIQPQLEGRIGQGWAAITTGFTQRPASELEIAGGWFMWALREAVAASGYDRSAGETLAFYQRMADEINAACDDGRIAAGPRRDSMMPPWRPGDLQRVLHTLPTFLDYFTTFRGFTALPPPSRGDAGLLRVFRDLTRWHLSDPVDAPELALPHQEQANFGRIVALHRIGKFLRPICAGVIIGGLLLWLGGTLQGLIRRDLTYLLIAAAALAGAALAVVLINALVHVLSFPNLSPGAFAQAYPLALLFGALGWHELTRTWPTRLVQRVSLAEKLRTLRNHYVAASPIRQALVAGTAVLLVLLVRKGDVLLHPQLWGEDGDIFFKQNELLGARALFEPYAGYLHLAPRLIAWLGSPLAPCGTPAVFVFASVLGLLGVMARLYSPRLDLAPKLWLALALVLVPHSGEVFLTPTNLQWVFALFFPIVLLSSDPRTRGQTARDSTALALAGLSGPQVILAAPLFAWRWWRRRTRASCWLLTVVLGCALVQVSYLLRYPRPPASIATFDVLSALATIAQRTSVHTLLGEWHGTGATRAVLAIGGLLLVALLGLALKERRTRESLLVLIAFSALILAASAYRDRFDLYRADDFHDGDRYFYVPQVLLFWILGVSAGLATWRGRLCGAALVLALLSNAGRFQVTPYTEYHWKDYCERIRSGERIRVPINPPGVTFEIERPLSRP